MYLLDTDIIIYILKGHPTVLQNLQKYPHDPVKLCVITLMELHYGAYKSQKPASNLAKIQTLKNLSGDPAGRAGNCRDLWNGEGRIRTSWNTPG